MLGELRVDARAGVGSIRGPDGRLARARGVAIRFGCMSHWGKRKVSSSPQRLSTSDKRIKSEEKLTFDDCTTVIYPTGANELIVVPLRDVSDNRACISPGDRQQQVQYRQEIVTSCPLIPNGGYFFLALLALQRRR